MSYDDDDDDPRPRRQYDERARFMSRLRTLAADPSHRRFAIAAIAVVVLAVVLVVVELLIALQVLPSLSRMLEMSPQEIAQSVTLENLWKQPLDASIGTILGLVAAALLALLGGAIALVLAAGATFSRLRAALSSRARRDVSWPFLGAALVVIAVDAFLL